MTNKIILLSFFFIALMNIDAQDKLEVFTMAKGDSLAIFLIKPPTSTEGVLIYRKSPSETEYSLLTEPPIRHAMDLSEAKALIGDYWNFLMRSLNAEDEFDVLRKLRGSDFFGGLVSLLNPGVAKATGRLFIDNSAVAGTEYIYKVVLIKNNGTRKDSIEKKVLVKTRLPQTPSEFTGNPLDGSIKLKWNYHDWNGNFDDLAVQFAIYRKDSDGSFIKINKEPIIRDDYSPREFLDVWLENNKIYSYFITAIDPIGNESAPSEIIELAPIDNNPPDIPRNLSLEMSEGFALLSWNISADIDAAGYNVFRSEGLDKEFIKINKQLIPTFQPYFIDSSLSTGIQYFYSISAIDLSGNESQRGNPVSGISEDLTPPAPPETLNYILKEGYVILTWTPSASKDVSGYYVYRGEKLDVLPRITSSLISETIYSDNGHGDKRFLPGGKYYYGVSAIDKAFNESEKILIEIRLPDNEPPAPPLNFIVKNFDGRFAEITCGGSPSLDVMTYRIYGGEVGGNVVKLTEFDSAPIYFKDASPIKGKRYVYYATAVDSSLNESAPSKIDTITIKDSSPPPSTRNVTAMLIQGAVEIKWERVVDFDLAGYNIYRSTSPAGIYEKLNEEPLRKLQFIDFSGTVKHFYKVRAVDTSGNESGAPNAVQPK